MDSMEINKVVAAVLTAGVAFGLAGWIGETLVHPKPLKESALKVATAEAPSAPPAGDKNAGPGAIEPLLASADPAAGEAATKKLCAACHSFNEGGKAGVGPNLYGVVGLPHGHMEGYNYSAALKGKEGPWTFAQLNDWLYKPSAYAPGTKMAFAGIASDKQRADVIAYLNANSKNPQPLPAAESAKAPAAASGNSESGGGAATPPAQETQTEKAAGAQQPPENQGGAPAATGGGNPAQ